MPRPTLRSRMLRGDVLGGAFVKTPAYEVIELMALGGLDFVVLDGEHAPFDRSRQDACLAMAKALDLPCLVRVGEANQADILQALDSGATGVIVPHVTSAAQAETVARWCRFGLDGRGYAGSTRWAGYNTRSIDDNLTRSREETVVIVMIEDPGAVAAVDEIAATAGVDGVFLGPADFAVASGKTDMSDPVVTEAYRRVGEATSHHGRALVTVASDMQGVTALRALGVNMFLVGSDQSYVLSGARHVARAFSEL